LLNLNELTQLVQGKLLHALAMKGLMSGCGIKRKKGEQILEMHGWRGKVGARDTTVPPPVVVFLIVTMPFTA
jgi:hypothetical protein